ncbi:MAG: AI-2E family transporter [Solirubrobacterales bacterium]
MNIDKKLLKYCIYAGITIIITYAGISVLNNVGGIFSVISNIFSSALSMVKPLIIAVIIAYLLRPGVSYIENLLNRKKVFKKRSLNRITGLVITYALVLGIATAVIYGIYVMVGGKLSSQITISGITEYLNNYFSNSEVSANSISDKLASLNISIGDINQKIAQMVSTLQSYFIKSIGGTTNFIASLSSNVASFFIALILSVYLINDYEYFKGLWDKLFFIVFGSRPAGNKIKEVAAIVDLTFKKYLKGQLMEATIVGILSSIVLYFIGIDYAIVIGIIAGICNMIPYIGPVVGTVLAVIMALLSGEPITALWAVIGMLGVQQIDNIFLAPKIVGDSVGLHPLFIMLAILIGGNAGGLIGMLTAVPAAASLNVLLGRWYNSHIENEIK